MARLQDREAPGPESRRWMVTGSDGHQGLTVNGTVHITSDSRAR